MTAHINVLVDSRTFKYFFIVLIIFQIIPWTGYWWPLIILLCIPYRKYFMSNISKQVPVLYKWSKTLIGEILIINDIFVIHTPIILKASVSKQLLHEFDKVDKELLDISTYLNVLPSSSHYSHGYIHQVNFNNLFLNSKQGRLQMLKV